MKGDRPRPGKGTKDGRKSISDGILSPWMGINFLGFHLHSAIATPDCEQLKAGVMCNLSLCP